MELNKLFDVLAEKIKKTFLFILVKNVSAYSIYYLDRISNYQKAQSL